MGPAIAGRRHGTAGIPQWTHYVFQEEAMNSSATPSPLKPALRAGGQALMLLSAPLNVGILRTLEAEPKPLQDLRREVGIPPQSTMRLYLRTLSQIGAVAGQARNEFPTSVDYEITPAGRELLRVGATIQAWLQASPGGPKELGSVSAKSAIKVLVEGWASDLVRTLATQPLSLTELNSMISEVNYPSLERRLTAMRQWSLVEVHKREGRMTPYRVTDWLRRAVAPVTAAMTWERTYAAARTSQVESLDVRAMLRLAIPLMDLAEDVSGKCRLAVEAHDGASPAFTGVLACVDDGEATSSLTGEEGEDEAWVSGKPLAWVRQLDGGFLDELQLGGNRDLALSILAALHRTANEPR